MLPAQSLTADLQKQQPPPIPSYIYLNVTTEGTHTTLAALCIFMAEQIIWDKQAYEGNKQHERGKSKTQWE